MEISLFGIKDAEYKKSRINCKSKFNINSVKLKCTNQIDNFISFLNLSYSLSHKRGHIAVTVVKLNIESDNGTILNFIIHPEFNKYTGFFEYQLEVLKYKSKLVKVIDIEIKIINLCNDTFTFKSTEEESGAINDFIEILVCKQS